MIIINICISLAIEYTYKHEYEVIRFQEEWGLFNFIFFCQLLCLLSIEMIFILFTMSQGT
jgi:hypothetical protein